MNKGVTAFLAGILVSFAFGVGLMYFLPKQEKTEVVYYLQTGVYQTQENAAKMQQQLLSIGLDAHIYHKENLNYVICGISQSEDDLQNTITLLNQYALNYVKKEVELEKQNSYELTVTKLLEVLSS